MLCKVMSIHIYEANMVVYCYNITNHKASICKSLKTKTSVRYIDERLNFYPPFPKLLKASILYSFSFTPSTSEGIIIFLLVFYLISVSYSFMSRAHLSKTTSFGQLLSITYLCFGRWNNHFYLNYQFYVF